MGIKRSKIPVSDSFSKRQLDLECLETMDYPHDRYVEMTPSVTLDVPRIVSGPQKLAQRYVVLFTTILGSDFIRPGFGSNLLGVVETGNVGSVTEIELLAKFANSEAMNRIREDDASEDFGPQPDDEKLDRSWIESVVVDTAERTVKVYASLLTVAGERITFIVPTSAGIY